MESQTGIETVNVSRSASCVGKSFDTAHTQARITSAVLRVIKNLWRCLFIYLTSLWSLLGCKAHTALKSVPTLSVLNDGNNQGIEGVRPSSSHEGQSEHWRCTSRRNQPTAVLTPASFPAEVRGAEHCWGGYLRAGPALRAQVYWNARGHQEVQGVKG